MTFRSLYLPDGKVLSPEAVERWIAEQAEDDGLPSFWLCGLSLQPEQMEWDQATGDLLLGGGDSPLRIPQLRRGAPEPNTLEEVPSYDYRWLAYSTPRFPVARERVRAGAVLDQLRRLALLLKQSTLWSSQQAATFVMTGLIPYAESFALRLEVRRGRRPRAMTHKHLELAVFTAQHEGETLAERLAMWNGAHPEWSYKTVEHFGGDSRLAVRRLVEEGAIVIGDE